MSELDEDDASPELVTRSEVLRRRSRRLKRLSEIYSDYYWALIEDLKSKHRQFYWNNNNNNNSNNNNNNNNYNNNNNIDDNDMCRTNGCKSKAMALARFCITHILSDPKQVLYKPCNYPLKSSPSGPIICMKPIARSLVPSLCPQHLEKAEKALRIALKKNSYANATTASKIAPKINVLIAESIRQIQSKRRAAKKDLRVDTTTTKYKTSDC